MYLQALSALASVYDVLAAYPDKVALATTAQDAYSLKKQGKIALFLGMENAGPIHTDLSLLRLFYRMGYAMSHSRMQEITKCVTVVQQKKKDGMV